MSYEEEYIEELKQMRIKARKFKTAFGPLPSKFGEATEEYLDNWMLACGFPDRLDGEVRFPLTMLILAYNQIMSKYKDEIPTNEGVSVAIVVDNVGGFRWHICRTMETTHTTIGTIPSASRYFVSFKASNGKGGYL